VISFTSTQVRASEGLVIRFRSPGGTSARHVRRGGPVARGKAGMATFAPLVVRPAVDPSEFGR